MDPSKRLTEIAAKRVTHPNGLVDSALIEQGHKIVQSIIGAKRDPGGHRRPAVSAQIPENDAIPSSAQRFELGIDNCMVQAGAVCQHHRGMAGLSVCLPDVPAESRQELFQCRHVSNLRSDWRGRKGRAIVAGAGMATICCEVFHMESPGMVCPICFFTRIHPKSLFAAGMPKHLNVTIEVAAIIKLSEMISTFSTKKNEMFGKV